MSYIQRNIKFKIKYKEIHPEVNGLPQGFLFVSCFLFPAAGKGLFENCKLLQINPCFTEDYRGKVQRKVL